MLEAATPTQLPGQLLTRSADGDISIWLVQHDSQPVWLCYWYRLSCRECALSGGIEFDVREIPGYWELPRPGLPRSTADMVASYCGERQHHAQIIEHAINAVW